MKDKFKYVVLFVILFIPFIYSFFYLKAYWNPYGKGNIDNLPVAIVNDDNGDKGKSLIDGIKDSKKLKVSVISEEKAEDGLYDGDYYAIIKIPKSFSDDMESVSSDNKRHATITYSPNQKANYLASQIINTVILNVEKNLDNEINSKIVGSLTSNLKEVPNSLDTINSGFDKLSDGTKKLENGTGELYNGTNTLATNYNMFNDGVYKIKSGSNTLTNSINQLNTGINTLDSEVAKFDSLKSNLMELGSGISELKTGSDTFTNGFNSYVGGVNNTLNYTESLVTLINTTICPKVSLGTATSEEIQMCTIAYGLSVDNPNTGNTNVINYLKISGAQLQTGNNNLNTGINTLATKVAGLSVVNESINKLQTAIGDLKDGSNKINEGAITFNDGVNSLNVNSNKILDGINNLNSGTATLNSGVITLNNSVTVARDELKSKTDDTRKDLKKVESLSDYSNKPINVETKEVNKVNTYGTAFTPLFVSVGLWVGCLMMLIVLYYDKDERFGIFGINDKRLVKKILAYHGLISASSIVLALLLNMFLDLSITNYLLYYGSFIVIGNAFMAIVLFLITNFKDLGKFIALILLVLQLAASGGTFPVEVVTKGFRWMNPFLPMTYSIKLVKEGIIKVENGLLGSSLLVLIIVFVVFFTINIVVSKVKENNN